MKRRLSERTLAFPVIAVTAALGVVVVACSGGGVVRTAPQVFDVSAPSLVEVAPIDETTVVMTRGELESVLVDLLGRHAELVAAVMVAAADGTATEEAVADLQANTAELTGAIGLVYGPVGAAAFEQLWAQHTQFFADYSAAAGSGSEPGREKALRSLHDYHLDFSSFADTATGGKAPRDVLVGLLQTHVTDLTAFVDAHAAENPVKAQAALESAREYMAVIAEALATAIAQQNPVRFPG